MNREAPERIWTIDLDGTGSMHPSCRGDDGAVEYVRADLSPQWRPISEAEHTTKARLVWVPERASMFAVTWHAARDSEDLSGWVIFGGGWRDYLQRATHFMPLPEAPNEP